MNLSRRAAAQFVFYAGIFIMVAGTIFLAGALAGVSRLPLLWSGLFIIIGGLFAIVSLKISSRPLYAFFAAFFILVGVFLFLSGLGIIPLGLAQLWPLLAVFAGLALIPAGLRHYGAIRFRYLIPILFFIVMGLALLPFSLDLVDFSFRRFVIDWWPALLVLAGLALVLLSLSPKQKDAAK
jgi:hypothetical protein